MSEFRITLLPINPEYADEMFRVLSAPEIYEFIPESPPASVQTLRDRYHLLSSARSPDGSEVWLNWVIRNIMTHGLIGYVQATVFPIDLRADIAYVLHPSEWGHGLGREACQLMILELQKTFSIKLLRATIDSKNMRSIRLMKRLGFKQTRFKHNAEMIRGVSRDEIIMEKPIMIDL